VKLRRAMASVCCRGSPSRQEQNRKQQGGRGLMRAHAVRCKLPKPVTASETCSRSSKLSQCQNRRLGEATHGTREFFQLKHRMLEFLASEMGFTIFSIEASMPEAYRLNDYVLNGNGDPAQLLKGMYFWTWDTQEVLAMIRWMREFNQSGKGESNSPGSTCSFPMSPCGLSRFCDEERLRISGEFAEGLRRGAAAGHKVRPELCCRNRELSRQSCGGQKVRSAVHQVARDHTRIRRLVVARGWRVRRTGIRQHAETRRYSTTDWKRYEIELPVAANTTNINFGAILSGDGTAWFDDLTVELDGAHIAI